MLAEHRGALESASLVFKSQFSSLLAGGSYGAGKYLEESKDQTSQ